MRTYVVNRPDEAAIRRALEAKGAEAVILALAWQAGLAREEMASLMWAQVSFAERRLELADRVIPLDEELLVLLRQWYEAEEEPATWVLPSNRGDRPLAPESISRLARQALDRQGQTAVRLMDLRHDWIIRQLAVRDWPAVSKLSGVEIAALQARFGGYVAEKEPAAYAELPSVDEFKLWRVLQAERSTPAGLALWLSWQMGLQAREIVALTWAQVDFSRDVLCLPDREIPLTNAVRRILEDARRDAPADEDHVLLTERSRKPMDLPRLSRVTRSALIRGGMEDICLRDLRRDEVREDEDLRILERAAQTGALSRADVMELLGVSRAAAYARLHRLAEQERLVRIGGKYYPAGAVEPPENHSEAIRGYLERMGFAYRQDIASLLRIRPKQCGHLLRRLVEKGELEQSGQKYVLPGSGVTEAN